MVSLNACDACLVLNTDTGEVKEQEHTSIKHMYKKVHIVPAQIPKHFNQPPTAGADIPALHGERRGRTSLLFSTCSSDSRYRHPRQSIRDLPILPASQHCVHRREISS